jgi:hypothetical protein
VEFLARILATFCKILQDIKNISRWQIGQTTHEDYDEGGLDSTGLTVIYLPTFDAFNFKASW